MQTHTTVVADPREMEDVYNALMWNIEPELTTEFLEEVELLHANETPEERELRGAWYALALDKFHEEYGLFVGRCMEHLSKIKKQALKLSEKSDADNGEDTITSIEDSLNRS